MNYRVGVSTVQCIIPRVCASIWRMLQPIYLPQPDVNAWKIVADGFTRKWQFPHCCGAIDGKHIVIQAPAHSGSMFYNYKGSYSLVLLAVVDHDYCFTAVDIGNYGHNSDGGIFRNSAIGRQLFSGSMQLPEADSLEGMSHLGALPYCFMGDEAFPLTTFMMRPFPGRGLNDMEKTFNYRLTRARRIAENAFGLLSARWRVFRRVINLQPHRVDDVVKASVVLHNFLRKSGGEAPRGDIDDDKENQADDSDASAFQPISRLVHSARSSKESVRMRQAFAEYFSNAGAVPWQNAIVHRQDL